MASALDFITGKVKWEDPVDDYSKEDGEEYETEFYLKGYDPVQIAQLATSKEFLAQWSVWVAKNDKNASEGSIRVRKIIPFDADSNVAGDATYELTTKVKLHDGGTVNDERNAVIDEAYYLTFRHLCDQGLVRNRYSIPITVGNEHGVLECDLFVDEDSGEPKEWLKIDLENIRDVSIDDIKLTYDEIIMVRPSDKKSDPEKMKKVREIFNKHLVSIPGKTHTA